MGIAVSRSPAELLDNALLKLSAGDAETSLAAAMRASGGQYVDILGRLEARSLVRGGRSAAARLRRLAGAVAKLVEARLPGGVRNLDVHPQGDRIVLAGVASSYYVKQVAQHVAMTALDGQRLVNEIEVRSLR